MSEHEGETATDHGAGTDGDHGARAQRLRRPTDGRVVAGVAAGLAEHLRIDVTLVRVLFVLAGLFNLLGVVVYGLLWILVPSGDEPGAGATDASGPWRADGTRWADRSVGFWAGIGLIGVGALWLLPTGPLWILGRGVGEGLLLPLLLIGGGLALWLSEDRRAAAPPDDPAPPPMPPAPPAGPDGSDGVPPPPTRERSPLVRITLGLALLVAGALWLSGPAGVADVRAEAILGAALLVVAAGLLVGSLWGRGRLLILAGVPLSLVLVVALLVPVALPAVPLAGTVGQGQVVVEDAADLQADYEHVAGELRLDLRSLELDEDATTRLAVGAGEVEVLLPEDLPVEVDAAATVGQLSVLGMHRAGVGPRVEVADGQGEATLFLEIRVGAGELLVTRDPPDTGSGLSRSWRPERSSSLVIPEVRR